MTVIWLNQSKTYLYCRSAQLPILSPTKGQCYIGSAVGEMPKITRAIISIEVVPYHVINAWVPFVPAYHFGERERGAIHNNDQRPKRQWATTVWLRLDGTVASSPDSIRNGKKSFQQTRIPHFGPKQCEITGVRRIRWDSSVLKFGPKECAFTRVITVQHTHISYAIPILSISSLALAMYAASASALDTPGRKHRSLHSVLNERRVASKYMHRWSASKYHSENGFPTLKPLHHPPH